MKPSTTGECKGPSNTMRRWSSNTSVSFDIYVEHVARGVIPVGQLTLTSVSVLRCARVYSAEGQVAQLQTAVATAVADQTRAEQHAQRLQLDLERTKTQARAEAEALRQRVNTYVARNPSHPIAMQEGAECVRASTLMYTCMLIPSPCIVFAIFAVPTPRLLAPGSSWRSQRQTRQRPRLSCGYSWSAPTRTWPAIPLSLLYTLDVYSILAILR